MGCREAQTAPCAEVAAAANPFDLLPNEIVTKILGLDERYSCIQMYPELPSAEELRRLKATCKLFRSLVFEAGLLSWNFRTGGSVARFNIFIASNLAARLKRLWLQVQQDHFQVLDLTSFLTSALSPFVETLESVTLEFCSQRGSRKLLETNLSFKVFQSCKGLRHILIRPVPYSISCRLSGFLKEPLPTLTRLSLFSLCMQSSELSAMLSQFPALQYLNVGFKSLDTSLSSDCVVRSSTLKTLRWSDGGGTASTRLEITCPCLKELVITTGARVSVSCPILEKLDASQLREVDAIATMSFVKDLSFSKASWSAVSRIIEAAPNAKTMSIWGWHKDTLQPLRTIGRLCPSLKKLQIDLETWGSICSNVSSNVKHETRIDEGGASCSFPKLQHIEIFLSDSGQDHSSQEYIARLETIAAACDNLKRVDISMLSKGDRIAEIEIGLQTLRKEYRSCLFNLQEVWKKL